MEETLQLLPIEAISSIYNSRGRIATVVIAKGKVANNCTAEQAKQSVEAGCFIESHDENAEVQLIAIGSYQLGQIMRAAAVLREIGIKCSVVAIIEPGRFRIGRDKIEKGYIHGKEKINHLIPYVKNRMFVSHTHQEVISGVLRPLDTGFSNSRFIGYKNKGGTLDTFGMLFANSQTWAHIIREVIEIFDTKYSITQLLSKREIEALNGDGDPLILK
jgi:phosphoketolase